MHRPLHDRYELLGPSPVHIYVTLRLWMKYLLIHTSSGGNKIVVSVSFPARPRSGKVPMNVQNKSFQSNVALAGVIFFFGRITGTPALRDRAGNKTHEFELLKYQGPILNCNHVNF